MKKQNFFIFAYWYDPRWKGFVGASVKIRDLAHNLVSMGHNVVLFLPRNHFKKEDFVHEIIEIPFINLPLLRFVTFNIYLTIYLLTYFLIKKPSVVYVRRMNSVIPGLYAKLTRAVLIYEVNDDPYHKQIQEGSKAVFILRSIISTKQDEINLRLCDRAFVITSGILNKIIRYNSFIDSRKLKIMPSGANTDLFIPLNKNHCRVQLEFDKHSKIIGFAGTLLNHQGIDILIKAATSVIKKIPEAIFLVIGEGPSKNNWIDLVERTNLNQHFIFAGQIPYEDLPTWLGATDICLAPFLNSAGYRSPVKIFDYMACGKPVVASKLNGTTDLFRDSSAILLIEPENPNILAEKIIELLNDKNKARRMGERGRKFVVTNFDRKIFAKNVVEEIQNVLV